MKKPVRYILGGILALLGFSSCSSMREARQGGSDELSPAQQQTVEEIKAEMDARYQGYMNAEQARLMHIRDSIARAQREPAVLLYAVPNVPFKVLEEK